MKKIKIKICGYDLNAPKYSYGRFLLDRLNKNYEVELSDDPDFVFFHERDTEYLKYPKAIRIFYTGENVHPDFNSCDYAISFDYLSFGDRHFRLPLYLLTIFYTENDVSNSEDLNFKNISKMTKEELNSKTDFCSFVYSNYLADPKRKELFDALSKYKKVNSGGRYMNNIGSPVENKLLFEKKHKFSIAFENSSRIGYTTEKLPAALAARTIPIYYGNPEIGKEFNLDRIINAHDFSNFDDLVQHVKEIDKDDEKYLEIINQPILAKGYDFESTRKEFDMFLKSIFDQPLKEARRISINAVHENKLRERERIFARIYKTENSIKKFLALIYSPFKKLTFISKLKVKFMQKLNRL